MNKIKTMESWKKVVERMRRKKPKLFSKGEGDEIAEYLYSVRGKKGKKKKVGKITPEKKDHSGVSKGPANTQNKLSVTKNENGHFNFKKLDIHQFIEPDQCAGCHDEIFKQWTGSMHNNSFNDPFWKATTKLFAEEAKTEGEIVEIKMCIKCHAPLGFRSGTITSPKDDFDNVPGILKQGLFCNWCHNISEAKSIENADYELDPGDGDDPSSMLGPFDDSISDFHPSKFSKLHTSSDFCGLCHNVSHGVNLTPIESTYDEWKKGPYNTGDPKTTVHCQDCHMRQTPSVASTGKTERPDNPGFACSSGPKRPHIPTHYFVGGNTIPGEGFGNKLHQKMATHRLKNAADLEIIESGNYRKSSMAVIKVKVINSGAGHYLPTGMSEIRQMWLDIKVKDGANRVIFSSGFVDKGGKVDPEAVMYNTVLGNSKGEPIINIALADRVLKDYRIPPKGYVMEHYSFFIPGYIHGSLTVEVTLRYRSSSQALVNRALKDKAPKLPIIDMVKANVSIDINS